MSTSIPMTEPGFDFIAPPKMPQPGDAIPCVRCGREFVVIAPHAAGPQWEDVHAMGAAYRICPRCYPLYPSSLLKAAADYFDYAIGLTTGEVFFFSICDIRGEWIHLRELRDSSWAPLQRGGKEIPFPRGLDVRLSAIVWCSDAPFGS